MGIALHKVAMDTVSRKDHAKCIINSGTGARRGEFGLENSRVRADDALKWRDLGGIPALLW